MAENTGITWEMLFKQGTIFKLKSSLWQSTYKIRPQDLGFKENTELKNAINITERLINRNRIKILNQLIYDARSTIERRSISFPIIEGARFVPLRKKKKVIEKLNEINKQFNNAKKDFIEKYEKYKSEMKPILAKALIRIAKDKESADKTLTIAVSKYPSKEELEYKIALKWDVFNIGSPIDERGSIEALQKEEEEVTKIMGEMIQNLRDTILEKIVSIQSLISKNETIGMKTVNATKRFLKRVDTINVFQDVVVKNAAKNLLKILESNNITEKEGASKLNKTIEETKTAMKEDINDTIKKAQEAFKTGIRKFK